MVMQSAYVKSWFGIEMGSIQIELRVGYNKSPMVI